MTVTDANGCQAIMSTNIAEPTEVAATAVEISQVSCYNGSDGSASVNINGVAQSYLWDNGETIAVATNLNAGMHVVLVIDSNGCQSTASVLIGQPIDPVSVVVDVNQEIVCYGGDQGVLLASASGGSGGYTFEWNNGTINNIANGLTVGQYIVAVTDITGCTAIASANLNEPGEIFASLSTVEVTCPEGLNSGSISVDTAYGGMNTGFTYSLDGISYSTDTIFQNLTAGLYEVFVSDLAGCSQIFETEVGAPDPILLDLGEDQTIKLGESTDVEAIVFNSDIIYDWTANNVSLACLDCDEINVTPVGNTLYQLTVVDTISGCTATAEMIVKVILERNVYVPNAFSPNGDGINDMFFINAGPEVQEIKHLRVFNRWGALVYEIKGALPNDFRVGWDGNFKGKLVESGVYIFITQVEFIDGEVLIYEGDISVIR